jgi:sugar O-acyltransferase (sialic acid O-acetyltransferase NeuD family)
MKNSLWFLGNGGHAKSLLSVLQNLNELIEEPKYLDQPNGVQAASGGLSIKSADHGTDLNSSVDVFCAFVGDDLYSRQSEIEMYEKAGFSVKGVIARSAIVSKSSSIDGTAQVFEGSYVGPAAQIGRHCVVNTGATIEHDCIIGSFSHISVRAIVLGSVQIGSHVYVGGGAVILPGVRIGDGAVIGAGAVVTKDVAALSKVIGSPAKPIPGA